jgi:NAD(P)H-hydrate epimerase
MKEIDQNAINTIGIPSIVLMERAALAVYEEIELFISKTDKILIACGTGNNGADGIAIGRLLHLKGYQVLLIFNNLSKTGTSEWQIQFNIANNLNVPMIEAKSVKKAKCDLLIDAVFGVGLSRTITGDMADFLADLTSLSPRFTVAVDIPSGIHSDNGQIMGIALKADRTVTFGYEKLGTALYPGKEHSGHVIIKDIGFPNKNLTMSKSSEAHYYTYTKADLQKIPPRNAHSNKGTFGKVLLIVGSKNMCGAAYLAGLAAYRTGAGLVKILTVEENREILQQQLPEAILECYHADWFLNNQGESKAWLESHCKWASVIAIGSGLGQEPYVEKLVKEVLNVTSVPTVIDADALNVISKSEELQSIMKQKPDNQLIITPHLGEMARLTNNTISQIQAHLLETAENYSRSNNCVCVLKDAVTIVSENENTTYINASGSPAMAKAGSGDVLTGIIAGLLALGMNPYEAATLGVYLHGLAGEQAAKLHGVHSILARDIANNVSCIDNKK